MSRLRRRSFLTVLALSIFRRFIRSLCGLLFNVPSVVRGLSFRCEQLPIDNPPTTGQLYSMPIRDYNLPPPRDDEGKAFAFFGEAQLCHTLDGRTFLRGGSEADRKAALEWFTLFMPDKRLS